MVKVELPFISSKKEYPGAQGMNLIVVYILFNSFSNFIINKATLWKQCNEFMQNIDIM
jgi:hypothetical protein